MKKVIFTLLFFLVLASSTRFVIAYNNITTHPALIDETIDFFNFSSGNKIENWEKEWIIEGVISEDTPPRWINHFYDPVYDEGWTGEFGPSYVSEELLRKFSDVFLSPEDAVPAPTWAVNQELQTKYRFYNGNQTWQKAIYEYVKNDNKKEAYKALGFVLHLLQDMSVPDHTRNDTHPGDSPYENYCANFTRDNIDIFEKIKNNNFPVFNSLENYFEYLAVYSNNYFFSKDTVNIEKYLLPKISKYNNDYAYGFDKNLYEFELARVEVKTINGKPQIFYSLEDSFENKILSAYWSRLSREAVLVGAGLMDLFFKEVERAEQDQSLLEEPPQIKAMLISIYGEFIKAKEALASAKDWIWDTTSSIKNYTVNLLQTENLPVAGGPAGFIPEDFNLNDGGADDEMIEPVFLPPSIAPVPVFDEHVSISTPAPVPAPVVPASATPEVQLSPAAQVQPLAQPQLSFSIDLIPAPMGAGAPAVENLFVEELPETATTSATSSPLSPPLPSEPPADTTPPSISFEVFECADSFSGNGCLLATATLNLAWQSADEDLDYFEISINGGQSTTTATSTGIVVADNSLNIFSARAKDTTGNWSAPLILNVEISSNPVVINEIAWMGTQAGTNDEWIELYNRTGYVINLDGWVLRSENNTPFINLSGDIPANGYYLLERKDDETISDIPADFIYGSDGADWSLNNDPGEILFLEKASTTMDKTTVNIVGKWPAGNNLAKTSMERYSPDEPGDNLQNWASNDTYVKQGIAADGVFKINGTPKARNSVNHYINKGQNIASDFMLQKSDSPYFVNNYILHISSGATLTIEPGVIIKFYNNAGIQSLGKIIAQGTTIEPIVFTAFSDDDYGEDLNGDATSTMPANGSWQNIVFPAGGDNNSVFENTIFRYGGLFYTPSLYRAMLETWGPVLSVSDSVFEQARLYAVKLNNSASVFSNNIFRENNNVTDPAGVNAAFYSFAGSPTIKDNTFVSNGGDGLRLDNSRALISGNIFDANIGAAIKSYGFVSKFENNSGVNNGINAVVIWGTLTASGDSVLFEPNDLPYLISGYELANIAASSTLSLEKGVVLKGEKILRVYGNLVINGDVPEDIILISPNTPPSPREFAGIEISAGGSLDARGFTLSYGGLTGTAGSGNMWSGGIYFTNASGTISNAVFDNNYPFGLTIFDASNIYVENVTFKNHNHIGPWGAKAAIAVFGGSSVSLENVTFENNVLGVWGDSSVSFTVDSVSWVGNTATTFPEGLF